MFNLLKSKKVTIQSRLIFIVGSLTSVALVLSATLFSYLELRENKLSMIDSLNSTASITAENIQAAVLFSNEKDAEKILSEFKRDTRIVAAAVYTAEKKLFSSYNPTAEDISLFFDFSGDSRTYQFTQNQFHLYRPVTLPESDEIIGYVYLMSNLDSVYQQFSKNLFPIIMILFSLLILTILATSKLQKIISNPILKLSQAIKKIKGEKDYSIRVYSDDYLEIEQLCDGFNIMLREIQHRDAHLQKLALYDELTGLANRSLFSDHFNQAIAHSKRTGMQLAICFLDLDNFKPVNDDFGHEVGDLILIEVAKRLSNTLREEDTVSRQGGDEFAILIGDITTYEEYDDTLNRLQKALSQPIVINGVTHTITASFGVTLYPSDEGDIDTLLRHADQAMYQCKISGKHKYHLFNPQHDQQLIQKHHHLTEIEQALNSKELVLYYQPKVNMKSGKVFGAEALIRWLHPKKGIIPPLDFLPVIAGTDLEIQIGDWVLNSALNQLSYWQSQGIELQLSVNISSYHLQSRSFITKLESLLTQSPSISSHLLQLEILESSALGDLKTISNIIASCHDLGVQVALDDFGTGYSSLTHLRSLPADTIKIDQSFIRDMLEDPSDFAIVDGVIGLTRSFSRNVIAEGVETTEHGLMLLLCGCNEAQGYKIARPMPANDFPEWIEGYIPNKDWLRCANINLSEKHKKIKLFKIIISHWNDKFCEYINPRTNDEKQAPVMDAQQCHCGEWIRRIKQEHIFPSEWIGELKIKHLKFHTTAYSMQLLNQNEELENDSIRLNDFKESFSNIITHLEKS